MRIELLFTSLIVIKSTIIIEKQKNNCIILPDVYYIGYRIVQWIQIHTSEQRKVRREPMLDQSYYNKADEIIAHYGRKAASLIPIMQDIRAEYRYLPGELLTYEWRKRSG